MGLFKVKSNNIFFKLSRLLHLMYELGELLSFLNFYHPVSFQKINEKPQIVNDYEAGRGIPNQAIIGKMERALGEFNPLKLSNLKK